MRAHAVIAAVCLACAGLRGGAAAQDAGAQVSGTYFTVNIAHGVSLSDLLTRIDARRLLCVDSLPEDSDERRQMFARAIDAVFREVSDILNIHIHTFRGEIRVLPDSRAVSAEFKKHFPADSEKRAFYLPEMNTIYLSASEFSAPDLGHQITYAVLSHFFPVLPPLKVQQILCGYVEYSIRQSLLDARSD